MATGSHPTELRRLAEHELFLKCGVRFTRTAKKCPECGGKSKYRRRDDVCMECAIAERKVRRAV